MRAPAPARQPGSPPSRPGALRSCGGPRHSPEGRQRAPEAAAPASAAPEPRRSGLGGGTARPGRRRGCEGGPGAASAGRARRPPAPDPGPGPGPGPASRLLVPALTMAGQELPQLVAQRGLFAPLPGPLRLGFRLAQLCGRKRRAGPPRRGPGPGPSPKPSPASAPPEEGVPEGLTAKLALQVHARIAAGSGLPALRRGAAAPPLAADTQAPPLDGGGGRGAFREVRSARPRHLRSSRAGGAGAGWRRQLGRPTLGAVFPDAGLARAWSPLPGPGSAWWGPRSSSQAAGTREAGGPEPARPGSQRALGGVFWAAAPVPPALLMVDELCRRPSSSRNSHTQPAHRRNY